MPKGTLSQKIKKSDSTAVVKERVIAARNIQLKRNNKINCALSTKEISKFCSLSNENNQFLEHALIKLGLSARAWHRILKVARTIADLDNQPDIEKKHITEALSYRAMDKLLIQLHKNIG